MKGVSPRLRAHGPLLVPTPHAALRARVSSVPAFAAFL
jgi:hypothetical protein